MATFAGSSTASFDYSIDDITNCFEDQDTNFVLYADDTNIFISGPSKEVTYLKANVVLEQVSKFMRCNLLHINMSACWATAIFLFEQIIDDHR